VITDFLVERFYIDKISSALLADVQIAWKQPQYLYAASG